MINAFMDKDTLQLAEKIVYTAGIVTGFWKAIDGFFWYMHKRQKGFITDLIKEELKGELQSLKDDIQDIKKDREQDSRYQTQQFQKIMDLLKK